MPIHLQIRCQVRVRHIKLIFGGNVEKTLDFQLVGIDGQFSSKLLVYAVYSMVAHYWKTA